MPGRNRGYKLRHHNPLQTLGNVREREKFRIFRNADYTSHYFQFGLTVRDPSDCANIALNSL